MRHSSSAVLVFAAMFAAPLAIAAPSKPSKVQAEKYPARVSRTANVQHGSPRHSPGKSIGSPTEGHLIGGAHLEEGPHLRIVPSYAEGDVRWGVEPLVQMIDHAARAVRKQFPDAMLSVGHLSRRGGGEVDRHASHESGRDADIGFYIRNEQGKPVYEEHFVPFKGDGTATSWPGAHFDDAKNWSFISAIAADSQARVTHIFVASPLRSRLLAYAEKVGAPLPLRVKAAELMAQPKGSLPHDDHFHVRIACPAGMDQCVEQPLAKRHPRGSSKGTVASAHQSGASKHGKKVHSAPSRPAIASKPAEPKAAKPQVAEESEGKSEASVPNLAPMVQGLDSAVIAMPIEGLKSDKPAPVSEAPAVDDADGVLEPSR